MPCYAQVITSLGSNFLGLSGAPDPGLPRSHQHRHQHLYPRCRGLGESALVLSEAKQKGLWYFWADPWVLILHWASSGCMASGQEAWAANLGSNANLQEEEHDA